MRSSLWLLPLVLACSEDLSAEAPVPAEAPVLAPGDWIAPDLATIPAGPEGDAIRRGRELADDTARLLLDNVGNDLTCSNCHLQGGTVPNAIPWIGANTRYPKYRDRSGKVDTLEERINGCFERSMNGTALPVDSEPMNSLVTYIEWMSAGIEDGDALNGLGVPRIKAPEPPDPERGRLVFEQRCVACHKHDGQGLAEPDGKIVFPPLWGDHSYNVGAGMARLNTAAAFVKWNMPFGQGGALTDQEAVDVASFFAYQDRPDFEKKALDWPNGKKPSDARY